MLPSCDTQYAPNLILQHGYAYDYDFNGNRVIANGSNYTTSTNNELTSDGTWSYTYDDEGNRISKQNSTHRELYTWDYRNRLTSVTQQTYNAATETWITTQTIEYAYDYNNVWIRKTLDSNGDGTADSKTIFIPENYQTTVQIDNNTVSHHYLWTPNQQDKLLADVTADNVLWTLTDHLGSIRDIIQSTATGVITQAHIIYDAYGNIISCKNSEGQTISTPILFAYTGKPFDTDTALQNNINRWYDASIGRWLSTDPIGFEGNDTNLYRYVGNKASVVADSLGLFATDLVELDIDKIINGFMHPTWIVVKREVIVPEKNLGIKLFWQKRCSEITYTITNVRKSNINVGTFLQKTTNPKAIESINSAIVKMPTIAMLSYTVKKPNNDVCCEYQTDVSGTLKNKKFTLKLVVTRYYETLGHTGNLYDVTIDYQVDLAYSGKEGTYK